MFSKPLRELSKRQLLRRQEKAVENELSFIISSISNAIPATDDELANIGINNMPYAEDDSEAGERFLLVYSTHYF
jgi:hypothetical protein